MAQIAVWEGTGPPTRGRWRENDTVVDTAGTTWRCTARGRPGTWASEGGGSGGSALPAATDILYRWSNGAVHTISAATTFEGLFALDGGAGAGKDGGVAVSWQEQRQVTDGVTNSTTTITSATAAFTAADVGRPVHGAGIVPGASIDSVTNATTAVLSNAATATASGVTIVIAGVATMLKDAIIAGYITVAADVGPAGKFASPNLNQNGYFTLPLAWDLGVVNAIGGTYVYMSVPIIPQRVASGTRLMPGISLDAPGVPVVSDYQEFLVTAVAIGV